MKDLVIGIGCALLRATGVRPLVWAVTFWTTLIRGLPMLVILLFLYYGLPSLGLRFDNWSSGLVALIIYNTAYMAEILRGAWTAQPREPIEAGIAFGFSDARLFRRIILPPLLLSAGPVIGNQMIQIIKDSAFLTIIAIP